MNNKNQRPFCPECLANGREVPMHKSGFTWSGRHKRQVFKCPACGRQTIVKPKG